MVYIVVLLLAVCLVGIIAARRKPRLRGLGIAGSSLLVAMAGLLVWWALILTQVVPIDPILRSFGLDPVTTPWFTVFVLGPPLVLAAAFAVTRLRRPS